jgi:hypothetical protein
MLASGAREAERRHRFRALSAFVAMLLSPAACAPPPTKTACITDIVPIAVGDSHWIVPSSLAPALQSGSFERGEGRRLCPRAGQNEVLSDHLTITGTTSSGPGAPPLGVQVTVRSSPQPERDIASLPALASAVAPLRFKDSAAARAGFDREDVGPLRVYTPTPPQASAFVKVVCGKHVDAVGPAARASNGCRAYRPYSATTRLEVSYDESGWPIEKTGALEAIIQKFIVSIERK